MKIFKVLILVFILIAPIGVCSVMPLIDDEQTCELLENFGEEEEDDSEEKELKDSEFLRFLYADAIEFEQEIATAIEQYSLHNELHNTVILEVNTPPPKYTMC